MKIYWDMQILVCVVTHEKNIGWLSFYSENMFSVNVSEHFVNKEWMETIFAL